MKILNLKSVIKQGTIGILIFILIFSSRVICTAQDSDNEDKQSILVIGTSSIRSGNTAAARKSAISDALVKGLEEYLARRLGSQGMKDNFSIIINEILPEAGEKIDNFHILAEEQTEKQYQILVSVKINEKMIEERLKEMDLMLVKVPEIKVLFMVSQENTADQSVLFWWENPDSNTSLTETELALHRVFQERGFFPVNRVVNFPQESYTPEMTKRELADEDVIRWGRLFSADVVVSGRCEVMDNEFLYANLKSYGTEKGGLISAGSRTSVIQTDPDDPDYLTESLIDVIEEIAAKMGPETIETMEAMESGLSKIEVELSGLRSFDQFRVFRSFLTAKIQGVESVVQSRIRPNSITIHVEYMGSQESFFEQISDHKDFPFWADISSPEEGKILVDLK